jgi:hypothetical protein
MLTIRPKTLIALETAPMAEYAARLSAWLATQPELATCVARSTASWCEETVRGGRAWQITQEQLVARLARLRLLRGDTWLEEQNAQEILQSGRDQDLKLYQLECLHEGVTHD